MYTGGGGKGLETRLWNIACCYAPHATEKDTTMSRIILDIEANGLKPTKIWTICIKEIDGDDQEVKDFERGEKFKGWLQGANVTEIIGHNILGYDIPVMERLLDINFSGIKLTDTLILSKLANPQREGGHSLKEWGMRLGNYKGDYTDWSALTPEMVEYCKQDVEVTHTVWLEVLNETRNFGSKSIELEHEVQRVVQAQIDNGWLLDQEKAYLLLAQLKEKQIELEENVRKTFKPLPKEVKTITPKYKKDGTLSTVGLKFLGDRWGCVGGTFSRVDFPEFNLGSRQQIAKHLQYFGWKPQKFTDKGSPIVDEAVLSKVKDIPQAQMIAEYLLIQKRIAQVTSWLEAVGSDGRVHGYVNTLGTVTGRMTHSGPNMAQVPASYSPYGKECRDVWTVPKGYKLVGMDAAGLELRMLAHYMNDEGYTNEVLHGDIHTANMKAAGLDNRDQAKTFIYAFLYGAGDQKIGEIAGGSKRLGAKLKAKFLDNTPALKALRDRVDKASKRGYVKGLDGRHIRILSPHKALNALLQGAGAIVMKEALTLLNEYATIYNIEYKFVGNIHDEIQAEVREDQAEEFGWLAVECLKASGINLNLRCPLDGEYKVGTTWKHTH